MVSTNFVGQNVQVFKQCFPKSVIEEEGIPMNIPVEYIFTVWWKNTDPNKGNDSYMNVVYTLTYVDQIIPDLTATQNPVDLQGSVTLDASGTKFAATDSGQGIAFKWICPDIFQAYCKEWDGSPVMKIQPQVFKNAGGIEGKEYDFTIETFSLNIGDRPVQSAQIFEKTLTITWANVQIPDFTLITPSRILVTKDNEIQIKLRNYRASDKGLKYTYTILPAEKVDPAKLELNSDNTILFIKEGALQWDQAYTLSVKI